MSSNRPLSSSFPPNVSLSVFWRVLALRESSRQMALFREESWDLLIQQNNSWNMCIWYEACSITNANDLTAHLWYNLEPKNQCFCCPSHSLQYILNWQDEWKPKSWVMSSQREGSQLTCSKAYFHWFLAWKWMCSSFWVINKKEINRPVIWYQFC